MSPGDRIFGDQVAKVLESKTPDYQVNDLIVGNFGWQTVSIVSPATLHETSGFPAPYKLSDIGGLSPSLGLGVLGMTGNAALFGFLEICEPKPGEIVVVSGAAGAVGSHVAQIAKHIGCIVIGLTGSDKKVNYLLNDLKLDAAFNYKTVDIASSLVKVAPQGIDCYFDNVGGEISRIVMDRMKTKGRVSVCGSISSYNDEPKSSPKNPVLTLPSITAKQLTVQEFLVWNWSDRFSEGIQRNLAWIKEGWLKYPEKIFEGFEKLPEAFIDMLKGGNMGKAVVRV
ncbi:LOW QUALITY PROTEIN: putative NADP-dependent oxidoreductase YfmJ [Planococcus citri]|uniref:LOW QUALITY PROTEIN: putative NADP-dependent oxidoreductase YfmJ n=1 Tax=Planococcus citri TaxID=170843 RepID=UPI0031F8F578